MGGNLLTIEDEAEREHIKTLIAQGGFPPPPPVVVASECCDNKWDMEHSNATCVRKTTSYCNSSLSNCSGCGGIWGTHGVALPVTPDPAGFWLGIKKNAMADLYVSHTVGDL